MGKKHKAKARLALSGATPRTTAEGCWLDTERTLEHGAEVDEADAHWWFWMEHYEKTVLFGDRWFLSAGCEEEGI